MAEFKLDRFKYNWKGPWQAGFDYKRDDIVRVGGKTYVCLLTHTSNAIFGDDLNAILPGSVPPQPQPRWRTMTSGRTFLGEWTTGTAYNLGDVIEYQGTLWLCSDSHVATNFPADVDNWSVFAKHIEFINDWAQSTDYGHGALVKYNGIVYKCSISHQSGIFLEDNINDWEVFFDGIDYRSQYAPDTTYRKNDLVKYGGTLWRCNESHVAQLRLDTSKFDLELPGFTYAGIWNSDAFYEEGDVVTYGGYLYFAIASNTDSDPSRLYNTNTTDDSTYNWIILSKTYNFVDDFTPFTKYKTGDIVQRGGNTYVAVRDVNVSDGDDSTLDYLEPDIWELLIPGTKFVSAWQKDRRYYFNEVVYHLGFAYKCNQEHVSTDNNFPGDNGSGYFYWDTFVESGSLGGLHDPGDLLTYGLSREPAGDGSSLGPRRVPIGKDQEVLSINEDLEVFWRRIETDTDRVYVANNGIDAEGRGLDPNKPFKTVRYGCEWIERNLPAGTNATVSVATGRYDEIGPISIPAGCAVVGDELRATTVAATGPIPEYENDFQYVQAYITYFQSQIFDIFNNTEIVPEEGNTVAQNTDIGLLLNEGEGQADDPLAEFNLDFTAPTSKSVALFLDFQNYIDFRVGNGDTDPTIVGGTTLTNDSAFRTATARLEANIDFISENLYFYINNTFSDTTFTKERVKRDIEHLLRAVIYDMRYDSTFKTILSARRYSNAVTGSALDDLFYMRDTTGLRNMTVEGLTGSLNPPGVFDLYQRPTGGACASLDPGYGPDDERVWIKNRSPYIQGVTNIGERCVGKKVDGSLHNGGNKSMTSNDFTQVLSDGIGAWITNGGRAELVSVFTYYCQVGYLAENGGVIRATNGNNSYGSWGTIADGNDATETPDSATINNRNNEAQVAAAQAGGGNDRIFIFEYENCGENYTEADATIVGAGANADVEYTDFRSKGIFNLRLVNTKGSGQAGGSNYLVRGSNAQETVDSTSTIRLSLTDLTQFESEIIGMRIIITGGDGVGQYGYVAAWDPNTLDATVRRESDGELGWDHIIPGTPINTSLQSTARYRIEPRVTVAEPPFSVSGGSLSSAGIYVSQDYGYTTAQYDITVDTGSGDTIDVAPEAATLRINRNGPVYDVTVIDGGFGYAVNDVLLIPGDQLGGETPANDLTVIVNTTTEDSSNSILTVTATGTPRGGRFVAIRNPDVISYSDNGGTWTDATLSFSGQYKKILAGGNRFIALAQEENRIGFSFDGENWVTRALPTSANWSDITYGNGTFVAVSDDSSKVVYSNDGLTWQESDIPENVTGDSSTIKWDCVQYGEGVFVAVSGNFLDSATSTDGITWTRYEEVLPVQIGSRFVAMTYGRSKFLAIRESGETSYSVDGGLTWQAGGGVVTDPGSGRGVEVTDLKYGNGVFVAGAAGTSQIIYTSDTGMLWTTRNLGSPVQDQKVAVGYTPDTGTVWNILGDNQVGTQLMSVGATALARADIDAGRFNSVKMWDPGSNYDVDNKPEITVVDNQFISAVEIDPRIAAHGVLAQPDFINRGAGYRTTSSVITITGDGFADIIPEANVIVLDGVDVVPGPGVQIRISSIEEPLTADPDDKKLFNGVVITDLGDDGSGTGTRRVQLTISPRIENEDNLAHDTSVELRNRFSQARVTFHDFLDIGTGNFEETNYPDIYAGGAYFVAAPENEVYEANGGRVFYTSTDQDGNFRGGELFSVQQSTGIVTISAEFFELDGLSELSLGGVRLGGSGAVVQEFSTDPTFAEDSNNVVPTQRAIATFLADRLSVGGEALETNDIQAGRVRIGIEDGVNRIENSADQYIDFNTTIIFDGQDEALRPTDIQGTIVSQMLLLKTGFSDEMQ